MGLYERKTVRVAAFFAVAAAVAALVIVAVPRSTTQTRPAAGLPAADGAGSFMVSLVGLIAANRYAAAWGLLDRRQQRIVPRRRYVTCESRSPIPGHLASIRVLSVRDQDLVVPGVQRSEPGKAITIRLVIAGGTAADRVVVTHTYHAVAAGADWRWFLTAERLAAYRAGLCPG